MMMMMVMNDVLSRVGDLCALASDASSELNVLGHDGHSLGVNGTEIRVLKETDEVGFGGFLKGGNGGGLEPEVGLVVLGNLSNESLEGELSNEQLSGLLVSSNLSKGDRPRSEAVGLLDSSSRDGGLPCCLGGDVLSGCFPSSRFTCGLFGSGHCD